MMNKESIKGVWNASYKLMGRVALIFAMLTFVGVYFLNDNNTKIISIAVSFATVCTTYFITNMINIYYFRKIENLEKSVDQDHANEILNRALTSLAQAEEKVYAAVGKQEDSSRPCGHFRCTFSTIPAETYFIRLSSTTAFT